MRREIPLAFTFLAALIMILAFFVPHAGMQRFAEGFREAIMIIGAFAVVLGVGNIIRVNAHIIRNRGEAWRYKILLLIMLVIMSVVGLFFGITDDADIPIFDWMFESMMSPLQAAMFSMLAFFIASAAYRAFRMRNVEASLLLIAATIIMIGQVPFGQWLSDNLKLKIFDSTVIVWIMSVPSMAGQRAILIGAAFGAISQAVRIMLGIERTYLGGE